MNTKLKVHLLQYFARKTRQQGMTLVDGLVLIVILMILAAVVLPSLLSQPNVNKQVEPRNNVGAMNRAQQAYHLENGDFADSLYQLGLGIRNSSNYEYSIEKTPLATFQYGTTLDETWKSSVGIVVAIPLPEFPELLTQAILCEQTEPGVKPSEPILQDGVLQCGKNMKDLSESGGIKVGKDWKIAYQAWKLARESKYDKALELAQTITDDVNKAGANSAIAHELVASGQNDKALELAQTITHQGYKSSVLLAIARKLAEAGEYESALEIAATIPDDGQKSWALKAIAPHLNSEAEYARALEIAATITDDRTKSEVLKAISPRLTNDTQSDRALEIIAATITDEREKASTLIYTAPHLSSEAQYDRALEIAETITNDALKIQAVEAIKQAKKSHK